MLPSPPEVAGAGELPYVGLYGADITNLPLSQKDELIIDFQNHYLSKIEKHVVGTRFVTD